MVSVIDNMPSLQQMLSADRAITLVAVPWSPWYRFSRPILDALEVSEAQWSPKCPVKFFVLWPEKDDELNQWYEQLCQQERPRFELHGHGYAPLWWLARGQVVDCLAKPYEVDAAMLQKRSARAFQSDA
jgi:hypothetical protein